MAQPLDHEELEALRIDRAHADLWNRETIDRVFATIDDLEKAMADRDRLRGLLDDVISNSSDRLEAERRRTFQENVRADLADDEMLRLRDALQRIVDECETYAECIETADDALAAEPSRDQLRAALGYR